jgi:hypothetical protein
MVALRVDYAKLDTLSESLRRVADGLEHIRADCEVTGRGWGGTTVRGSMDDFTGNWDAHREKVTAAVQELARLSRWPTRASSTRRRNGSRSSTPS